MRHYAKWYVAVVAIASIGVAYGQANITGAWVGKVHMDMSKMPKVTDPNQKKMMEGIVNSVKSMRMHLNLKGNKTFSMKVTGIPAGPNATAKKPADQTAEGTWSQKGSTITLKVTKANGAAPKGQNPPQDLKVVGKTLELNNAAMPGAKVVFSR
jgi:hypothetical protein